MAAFARKRQDAMFLLNIDTWLTNETLDWLEQTQVPTFVVGGALGGSWQINVISEEAALRTLHSPQAAESLKLMTNGEAAYRWLTESLPEDHFVVRQLSVCSRKSIFRQVSEHAYPDHIKAFSAHGGDGGHVIEDMVDAMGLSGTMRKNYIVKPSRGFCALGVKRFSAVMRMEGASSGGGDPATAAAALKDFAETEYGPVSTFLVESYLQGPQYTCDGYFDSAGEARIVTVSLAPKFDAKDIREIVLGTNAALLRVQLPLAKKMMMRLQASASELFPESAPFFRNFCFMVEYRVPPGAESIALPIEVNSMRHEGKSPAYAKLIHEHALYDYFFNDLGDCDPEAVHAHITQMSGVDDADAVAAMVFARKPAEAFPADRMDFAKWVDYLRRVSAFPNAAMPHEESFAHSDGNCFFGVAMVYFPNWSAFEELLVPKFEEQFMLPAAGGSEKEEDKAATERKS